MRARAAGVYPDSLTGPEASYTLWRCLGGQLTVDIASQADLFTTPQTVTAVSGQRSIGRLRIRPGQEKTLTVPARPEGGHCAVDAARHPDRRPCPSARHAGHPQPGRARDPLLLPSGRLESECATAPASAPT